MYQGLPGFLIFERVFPKQRFRAHFVHNFKKTAAGGGRHPAGQAGEGRAGDRSADPERAAGVRGYRAGEEPEKEKSRQEKAGAHKTVL